MEPCEHKNARQTSDSGNSNQIYFAASVAATIQRIDGGSGNAAEEKEMWRTQLYQHIRTKGCVTNPDLWEKVLRKASEGDTSGKEIYDYSITDGVLKSTHVVAEVSRVSHGVGIEIGMAIAKGIPVLCLYRAYNNDNDGSLTYESPDRLSRVVRGAPVKLVEYESVEIAKEAIDNFFLHS